MYVFVCMSYAFPYKAQQSCPFPVPVFVWYNHFGGGDYTMPNFGIPSYAERLMASERILTKNDPDFLQLEAIKEQTTVTKQNAEKIDILNKQISTLQQQLKEESENNAKALKREHNSSIRWAVICAILSGAASCLFTYLFLT